jgi:hypothetical protein
MHDKKSKIQYLQRKKNGKVECQAFFGARFSSAPLRTAAVFSTLCFFLRGHTLLTDRRRVVLCPAHVI